MSRPWEADFAALSTALGEPMEAVAEALGPEGMARAEEIAGPLQSTSRPVRAAALAAALAAIAADLDALEGP